MSTTDTCSAGWCADDDYCAITCTADLLGRKWHPVIVHRLLESGPMGFAELQDAIDGVASNVLSNDLEHLQEHNLVVRHVVSDRPYRVEYELTHRGEALQSVIDAMAEWGETHLLSGTDDRRPN